MVLIIFIYSSQWGQLLCIYVIFSCYPWPGLLQQPSLSHDNRSLHLPTDNQFPFLKWLESFEQFSGVWDLSVPIKTQVR